MRLESEGAVSKRICSLMHSERKHRKISQQDLCDNLGITQGLLSKIENVKLKPSVYVWLTFCKMFDLKPEIAMNDTSFKKRMGQIKKQNKLLN